MHSYLVEESKKITPSTLLLTLKRDEQERPLSFQPGQYAAISFEHRGKKSPTRCFSIVSSPTEQNTLQFSMRVHGRFTSALQDLQKNDFVNVSGPFGGFVFDTSKDMKAVFLAGGIGITPFISMMRYLSRLGADNEVTLLYSSQTQDDIPFKDELLSIQKHSPNLKTIFVIGKGPIDQLPPANAATGFISPELFDKVTDNKCPDYKFFICGPPGFMKAMSDSVSKKGVPKDKIMTEAFTQSSPKQTSILRSWPANAYAMGAIGIVFGSLVIMVNDLLKTLPPSTTLAPTKNSPYFITNARQQQLDQLVNGIAPSPSVITPPSTTTAPSSGTSSQSTAPTTAPPVFLAPAPKTTASTPPP